jgi:hypothetical protein
LNINLLTSQNYLVTIPKRPPACGRMQVLPHDFP